MLKVSRGLPGTIRTATPFWSPNLLQFIQLTFHSIRSFPTVPWCYGTVTNLSDSLTNFKFWINDFSYNFFFNWQTETKQPVLNNNKFIFFFNCSNWEKFMEKIHETNWWKHLMNSLQVILCQTHSFLHELTQNMMTYYWMSYEFSTRKL